jgi:hypothetical protein
MPEERPMLRDVARIAGAGGRSARSLNALVLRFKLAR